MPNALANKRDPVPAPRRQRGNSSQNIGDVYLKKLTIKPREHWPQWVITRIAPNEDGIVHATLSLIGNEATTRRMSAAVLDEGDDWELMQRAENFTASNQG
jgi:hypothetical protein